MSIIAVMLPMVSCVFAEVPVGYGVYTQWEEWARLRVGVEGGLASSYDRTEENSDWSHYESPPGLLTEEVVATVKTIEGPGMIYRFWMPHVMAKNDYVVRMYFDGELTARIDTNSIAVMGGTFSYFSEPLITTCAGGQVCYEPIGFAQSLRIETVNKASGPFANRHYYQYSYLTFPSVTEVNSYTGQLTSEEQQARSEAVSLFENVGQHPAGDSPTAETMSTGPTLIPGGGSLTLALPGPGVIRKINVRMDDTNDTELYGVQLQVYYDDTAAAAIDVSVAHFFGAGKERAAYRSLPIGTDPNDANEGFYCYWPMPFRESVEVKLCNTTDGPISIDSVRIEYEPGPVEKDMCYLYAVENSLTKSGETYHTILSTTGRGHYVGDLLYVQQDFNSFYILEGDDVISVDGAITQWGTGLEDTYNGGAYYNWVAVQADEPEGIRPQSATRPLNGILYVHREEGIARADQYRWRIADCIPFSQSIEVNVECRYGIDNSEWTSVGFWYQLPGFLEDLDGDGDVDCGDFAEFAEHWRESDCGQCGWAELTGDGKVDANDLREFSANWLAGS